LIASRTFSKTVYANQSGTSRFKGVFWHSWPKKWRACIRVDGKDIRLGRFTDQAAAAEAYDEGARCWFGECGGRKGDSLGYPPVTRPR
jgi:hypothetical protein